MKYLLTDHFLQSLLHFKILYFLETEHLSPQDFLSLMVLICWWMDNKMFAFLLSSLVAKSHIQYQTAHINFHVFLR